MSKSRQPSVKTLTQSYPSRRTFEVLRYALLAGAGVAALAAWSPSPALAQDDGSISDDQNIDSLNLPSSSGFGAYALSVSPQITYSDNVDLDPEGQEQSDGLASVALRGGLLIDRVNFTGIVNGKIELGSYFDPASVGGQDLYDQTVVDQNIVAAGTLELDENFLFLDIAGATERRALDERSRFSSQSIAANDRQAASYSISFSPYIFTEFSNDSTVEVRYRFIGVQIEDDDAVQGIANFLNDTESHEVVAQYASGRLLDRLSFSVRAYLNQTNETGSDVLDEVDFGQASISGSVNYPVSQRLSLVGTIGYDDVQTENNDVFDDGELSGTFWKAGILATPGRRTELRLEAGERYGGTLVEADAEYRYSSRLRFRGDISRTFNTASILRSRDRNILQSDTLAFAEELRLLQNLTASDVLERTLQYNDDLRDLSVRDSGLATANTAGFSVVGNTRRNNFAVRIGYDDADFGFEETETISLSGGWDRRITRKAEVYVSATYQSSSTDISGTVADCVSALSADPATAGLSDNAILQLCQDPTNFEGETETASFLAGLGYQVFKDVTAFIQFARTERFADTDALEFEENAVTAGMTMKL